MRKSIQNIAHMVKPIPYPRPLPDEVAHLHCYVIDSGHCILAVPKCFAAEAADRPMDYEVPLPAKYVLETGWEAMPDCDSIMVDVPYDDMMGAVVPSRYEEW